MGNTTIFAHRGASAHAPENTLAAFILALKQGADAIELDAKLTADGHVVVIHDQTVDRTTGSSGQVKEMSLAALRKLDAGSHFDFAFRGEPIPMLEEVFAEVGGKIFINVELTNYASLFDGLPEKVAALVERHDLTQSVLFSSFNPIALRRIHRLLPQVPLGLLCFPGRKGSWMRGWLGRLLVPYQALHPEVSDATPSLIAAVHHRNRRVNVYTVNRPEDMRRLFAAKVDGIFTDDPLLARKILAENR
jgi:glycerophosphoryl diester phosphodiesterase